MEPLNDGPALHRLMGGLVNHEKFIDTSWDGKAGMLVVFGEAVTVEGRFRSRSHVEKLLGRAGCPDPPATFDELPEREWLDLEENAVLLHGWMDHQPRYRGPSDDPDAVAQRRAAAKAAARVRRQAQPPDGPVEVSDGVGARRSTTDRGGRDRTESTALQATSAQSRSHQSIAHQPTSVDGMEGDSTAADVPWPLAVNRAADLAGADGPPAAGSVVPPERSDATPDAAVLREKVRLRGILRTGSPDEKRAAEDELRQLGASL